MSRRRSWAAAAAQSLVWRCVTAHPEQVSVLVAHEPPLLTLLTNAADELAKVEEIYQTYLTGRRRCGYATVPTVDRRAW